MGAADALEALSSIAVSVGGEEAPGGADVPVRSVVRQPGFAKLLAALSAAPADVPLAHTLRALAAVLCMLLGGGKKAKSGVRRASMAEAYGVDDAAAAARDAAAPAPAQDKQTRSVLRTVKDVLTFASFVFIARGA